MAQAERFFRRTIDALEGIFSFADAFLSTRQIDDSHRFAVNFALEELFTNMIKYGTETTSDIRIELEHVESRLRIRLTDFGVEPFDITEAPDANVGAKLEDRKPGGLGLHLVRRLMDEIRYDYDHDNRLSTITLTKNLKSQD